MRLIMSGLEFTSKFESFWLRLDSKDILPFDGRGLKLYKEIGALDSSL